MEVLCYNYFIVCSKVVLTSRITIAKFLVVEFFPVYHRSKLYDIFHDENVEEVTKVRPVLEEFDKRLDELLSEWPEHPTLAKVFTKCHYPCNSY